MLQRLIAQSADENDDDAGPNDEEINDLMARPNAAMNLSQEEEAAKYKEMDEVREREARGGAGARSSARGAAAAAAAAAAPPPRLVANEELPAWLQQAEHLRQEAIARVEAGETSEEISGPRQAKRVQYQEQLTERDFTRMLQLGLNEEEYLRHKAQRMQEQKDKEQRAEGGGAAGEAAETQPEGGGEPPALDATLPPRKRKAASQGVETPNEEEKHPAKSAKRAKGAKEANSAARASADADGGEAALLGQVLRKVSGTTKGSRKVAKLFERLPRPSEAQGYYEIIQRPISLAQMREQLKGGGYTLERLDRDFALMVRNAKQYNAPDSQVDRDAETLWGAFSEARAKTFPAAAQLPQRYDDEALL